jgi:pimeloyl-ACP methyl ester carboxylesterase
MKNSFLAFIILCLYNISHCQTIDTLIDVGKYKLHFNIIKGNGTPILFEAGNGSDASVWKNIAKEIHDTTGTTVISYDRAGLGKSGIDTTNINLITETIGLEKALKKLGYFKKLFLVNHSFGSYYNIIFTTRNKNKIEGAVFIDPALPCNYTKKRNNEGNNKITLELWERIKKEAVGLYYVLKNYEEICDLMETKKFPDKIPATVIAAENQVFLKTETDKKEWKDCVKNFGTLPNHTYVFANNCGHNVWQDNPQLVKNEIVKLFNNTNNNRKKPNR